MLQGAPIPLLFEIARLGSSGKVRLDDGRRTVTLAVRRRNVVGVKGMPELWDRLASPTIDTSTCRGHLLQDIPRLMASGVQIDQIFDEAVFTLGRFLADLVDLDEIATFREIPEPDTDAVGLPKSLMHVVVEGLRTFRQPRDVRRSLAAEQERPLVVGRITPEMVRPWSREAAELLEKAGDYPDLNTWLIEIDRAPRGRRDQFWRALDLCLQVRALELEGSKRTPMAVRRVESEDLDSTTPSFSGFSSVSVAPDVPRFLLDLEDEESRSTSSRGPRSQVSEPPERRPSWRRSEKVTLGRDEVFELPPDDDESSFASRRSPSTATATDTGLDDHDDVFAMPADDDDEAPTGTGLDDHDDVFALPPDDDEDDDDQAPTGTGLDDHDDVFALPPDDSEDEEAPSQGSVVSFAADEPDDTTEMADASTTLIIDDDSEHVVRPLFKPRRKKKT